MTVPPARTSGADDVSVTLGGGGGALDPPPHEVKRNAKHGRPTNRLARDIEKPSGLSLQINVLQNLRGAQSFFLNAAFEDGPEIHFV